MMRFGVFTTLSVVLGVLWLGVEAFLRDRTDLSEIVLDPLWIAGLVVVSLLAGIAIRARASLRGELGANGQLLQVATFSVFLPAAILGVLYAVALTLSVFIVLILWVLLIAALLLAVLFHVTIWAGLVGAGRLAAQRGAAVGQIVVAVCVYVVFVCLISHAVADDSSAAWTFASIKWVFARKELIPVWDFGFEILRGALRAMRHDALINLTASVTLGLLGGLFVTSLARWLRRSLMQLPRLRPYLPMGSAPLPDGIPVIDSSVLPSLLTYVSVAWVILVISVAFP